MTEASLCLESYDIMKKVDETEHYGYYQEQDQVYYSDEYGYYLK